MESLKIMLFLSLVGSVQLLKAQPKVQQKMQSVCKSLNIDNLFRNKDIVIEKLKMQAKNVEQNVKLESKDRGHRLKLINIINREINDSVVSLHDSIGTLKSLLRGERKSLLKLKEISKRRLEQLQSSMVSAEDEYNVLLEEEKYEAGIEKQRKNHQNQGGGILKNFLNELLGDISIAADKLESKLDDDAFETGIRSDKKFNVETVIKVSGEETSDSDNEGIVMLIDSESNHFVLSKPNDSTTTHIDHNLLKEIIFITTASFLLVILGNFLNLPSNFACVIAGLLLGPSGGNYLKSIVQIETMGEFGVFFILFSVGLEFSPDKLKKVLKESITGVAGIFSVLVLIGLFWGTMFSFSPKQSVFVTLCLAFSSTPLITKFLRGYTSNTDNGLPASDKSDEFVNLLMAMLVIEDVLIGILMALLPLIAGHNTEKSHSLAHVPVGSIHNLFHGAFGGPGEALFFTLFELVVGLTGIFLIAYVLSKYVAARYFRSLNVSGSHESYVLGIMSAVFFMLLITEYFGVSMELGCFISGAIIGNMGEQVTKKVTQTVEPFKDFFAALFFASIGFHVFPSFLLSEFAIFIPITAMAIFTKFFVSTAVIHYVWPKEDHAKWIIGAGLAQMSEFSFLLGSRARRFGLIGREVFLVILSMTTLSLLFSPFMWRFIHTSSMKNGLFAAIRNLIRRTRN